MDIEVVNNEAANRFEAVVDGVLCVLEYRVAAGVMAILHTGVPEQVGGRGIAAQLTEAAISTARSRGWKITPSCSYAEVYFKRHPEYADLLSPR